MLPPSKELVMEEKHLSPLLVTFSCFQTKQPQLCSSHLQLSHSLYIVAKSKTLSWEWQKNIQFLPLTAYKVMPFTVFSCLQHFSGDLGKVTAASPKLDAFNKFLSSTHSPHLVFWKRLLVPILISADFSDSKIHCKVLYLGQTLPWGTICGLTGGKRRRVSGGQEEKMSQQGITAAMKVGCDLCHI